MLMCWIMPTLPPYLNLDRSTILGNIPRFPTSLGSSQSYAPPSPFTKALDIFQGRRMNDGCCGGKINGLHEPGKRIPKRKAILFDSYRVWKKEEWLKGFMIVVVRRSFLLLLVVLLLLLPVVRLVVLAVARHQNCR